jgi:hypothetical protein
MKRPLRVLCVGLSIALLTANVVWAQAGSTAQISGTVKDNSGGVLPGVDVTVTQTDTGVKRNAVTDADGGYVIPNLPIGPYRIDAMLQGFRAYSRTGIVLQVGGSPVINIEMAIGNVAESITVQGESPLIDTNRLGVGQVMENKRILELPLNGRNAAELLTYLPAALPTPGGNATSRSMGGVQGGVAFSIAGGVTYGIGYTLDGSMHNNPYDNLNLPLPFPDALQEFKAETSAMTAQNGMHSAASVNAVTKSGTNAFHGDLFEFFRHYNLNATDPFAAKDAQGNRRSDGLKRNQYGVTLGGPIRTDKTFFFGGYQGTNTRVNPTDNFSFVPTAAMLAGDFTAFASPACNAGRQVTLAAPFANNQISPSQFSPAALRITSKLPTTTDPCGRVQYGLPAANDDWQAVTKVDHQFNQKHSLFGRYIATSQFQAPPFSLPEAEENLLVTRIGGRDNLAQTFTLGENWVLSSTTLNAFRIAYNRTDIHRTSTDFFSAPEVGVNMYSYRPHYMLLTVTNGFQLGGGTESESVFTTSAWQISDDVTMVRGRHQFAFGVSAARWKSLSQAHVRSPGQLSVGNAVTGLGLADFLLGRLNPVNGLVQAAPNTLDMEQGYLGLYGQDAWRIGSRITLNVGLRWEPFFPQQLVNGAVYQFSQERFDRKIKSKVFPNAPAGLYFPGDEGFPTKAGMLTQWDNFAPRIGLAWDPTGSGRTNVRASYGKGYDFINGQFHLNTSVAPPWGSEIRLNGGQLDDPFRNSGQTNIFPVTFDQNAPFSLNGPFLSLSNDLQTQYVHMFNVSYEQQFGTSWLASVGYVGSRTRNILQSTPLNNAIPGAGTVNSRRPLFRADPVNGQYYGPLDLYVSDGQQNYNGLLLSFSRRAARGLGLNVNYTLSKCYGSPDGGGGATTNVSTGYNIPSNPAYDDGNCTNDRRHNFVFTASAETPDFEQTALRAVASGWRLVGTFRAYTGPWLTISTGGVDVAQTGQTGTQRADVVSGQDPYGDMSINPLNNGMRFLNPLAFRQPGAATFGNSARNSVRGRYQRDLSLAITRNFRLGTRTVEARIEMFNAFNWFQWGQPNTAVNSNVFGQITSAGAPRQMQLAVKYVF